MCLFKAPLSCLRVTPSEAQGPATSLPQAGSPRVCDFDPARSSRAILLGALPPPPENHLRCYLVLFALLTLFMAFCNQKKTGDEKALGWGLWIPAERPGILSIQVFPLKLCLE